MVWGTLFGCAVQRNADVPKCVEARTVLGINVIVVERRNSRTHLVQNVTRVVQQACPWDYSIQMDERSGTRVFSLRSVVWHALRVEPAGFL